MGNELNQATAVGLQASPTSPSNWNELYQATALGLQPSPALPSNWNEFHYGAPGSLSSQTSPSILGDAAQMMSLGTMSLGTRNGVDALGEMLLQSLQGPPLA